jgi:Kef-type K+ transport system membrane component KefB
MRARSLPAPLLALGALLVPVLALASAAVPGGDESGEALAHAHLPEVLAALALVLVAAKVGGDLAVRVGQPAVLGELAAGVLLGALPLAGVPGVAWIAHDFIIASLAEIGVVILLFEVGIESTVRDMARVGRSAFLVAAIGVVVPFGLGWGVGLLLLPGQSAYVHAFLGATLTATSVGITVRVLKDLGKEGTREARIVLGAAVVDDVLGLLILAIVSGIIGAAARGGTLEWTGIAALVAKALGFLVAAIALGIALSRRMYGWIARLRSAGLLLPFALAFCFLLAWLAGLAGLAPIVGAFAAGLVFEDAHADPLTRKGEDPLEAQIAPVAKVLVPIFFVVMGMRTDLRAFADPAIVGAAAAITAVAVLGKLAAGLGALEPGIDRLSVGIGMIPRGEVGLIFASVGLSLAVANERIVDAPTYAKIVVMVILTTVVTPPALKWSLARRRAAG